MPRDRTARTRIRQYLASHGAVEDRSGHATGALKDAIEYLGSSVAFIQMIAAMDRDGEIEREIKGKRTYRIALSEEAAATAAAGGFAPTIVGGLVAQAVPEIDYDRLARAVVHELLTRVTPAASAVAGLREERDDYARRLEVARTELDELLGAAEAKRGKASTEAVFSEA